MRLEVHEPLSEDNGIVADASCEIQKGFGHLSGQNGPPEKTKELGRSGLDDLGRSEPKTEHQTEKGAKHSKKWVWGSPFCRIQAPQRPKRTTRKRNEHGHKHRPDLGRSEAKTEHQSKKGAKHPKKSACRNETQARDRENQRAGEARF